jgi:4-hydroxythreonine-4-phosphate dehydrogenase
LANIKKIIITTGDTDGIGLEVSLKALLRRSSHGQFEYLLFVPAQIHPSLKKLYAAVQKRFVTRTVKSLKDALLLPRRKGLTIIANNNSPASWVEQSARACVQHPEMALVTAPLSKELIKATGYKAVGHTEILKSVSKSRSVFMAFLGQHFHVLLATGHVSLRDVPSALTKSCLSEAIQAGIRLRAILPTIQRRRPIALVGLNPHAGEHQIIGAEESLLYKNFISQKYKKVLVGPLVPDVAYQKSFWRKYSLYIAPYHDQGLIPFKLVHGHENGTHVSVGLPFIRTSVDHGTAKDIFGRNRANASSMEQAIRWACHFLNEGHHGI